MRWIPRLRERGRFFIVEAERVRAGRETGDIIGELGALQKLGGNIGGKSKGGNEILKTRGSERSWMRCLG